MKKTILLVSFVFILYGCSDKEESCKSKCKFTKDILNGKYFYMNIPVDCATNTPTAETFQKIKDSQSGNVIFCGCE